MLEEESDISTEIIYERGYYTAIEPQELRDLGFADHQLRVPALVVPIYGPDGLVVNYPLRSVLGN